MRFHITVFCSERAHSCVNDLVSQTNGEETLKYYAAWSDTYEADLSKLNSGYNHPRHVAEAVALALGEFKAAKILDVCAGTGLGGQEVILASQISSLHSFTHNSRVSIDFVYYLV